MISLMLILALGYLFGTMLSPKKESSYKLHTLMLKARLEWMQTDDYKKYQEDMNNLLYYPKIDYLVSFRNEYWIKPN